MRTARFAPDGTFAVGVYRDNRVTRYFSTWQATPWLETTLSYTSDRLKIFGVDRSLDIKIRLLTEGSYIPEVAIGIQDALGMGRFGGEYIVASKRYYDVDFTMGLAWGYLGSRGGISNMFRLFDNSFTQRSAIISSGTPRTGSYFSGQNMAFFAGAEYHPPIRGLTLKAEYSGIDTTGLAAFATLKQRRAFSFGVNYKLTSWAAVGIDFDQGNRIGIRLTFRRNLRNLDPEKWFRSPKPVPILVRKNSLIRKNSGIPPNTGARAAYSALKKRQLSPISVAVEAQRVEVRKTTGPYFNDMKNIGRTARILTRKMPGNIEEFIIVSEKDGLVISRVSLLRQGLEKAALHLGSPEEIRADSKISDPGKNNKAVPGRTVSPLPPDRDSYHPRHGMKFNWGFKPELLTHFGGNKDGRFRADLYAALYGSVEMTRHLTLSATLKQYIVGNIDKIPAAVTPNIPPVRSNIGRYSRAGRTGIERLKLDYTTRVAPDTYLRLSGGLLETMYGGVVAEILYRPYRRHLAFGLDLNWVRQRGFNQMFSFRNYDILTGHATVYYQSRNHNITSIVSVGRYLAGDYGATFDISRRFTNGIRIGAWATVTTMSSTDFGRGSFDKGIYITMPLEIFWGAPTQREIRFNFNNLDKNGGQMLNKGGSLYDLLSTGDNNRLYHQWPKILQ